MSKKKECFELVYSNSIQKRNIKTFQEGTSFEKWHSGDRASILGHRQLLRFKQQQQLHRRSSGLVFDGRALEYATEANHFNTVEWIYQNQDFTKTRDWSVKAALKSAAQLGHLGIVEFLSVKSGLSNASGLLSQSAANGHLHVLKWLDWNFPEDCCTPAGVVEAAKNGHFGVIEWLHSHQPQGAHATPNRIDPAAGSGNIGMVKWLHQKCGEACTSEAIDRASKTGNIQLLQWIEDHFSPGCTTVAVDNAAGAGELGVIEWLHRYYPHVGGSDVAMAAAATNGHLETVEWLHHNWTNECAFGALDHAASNGHLKVLQWFYQHREERCTVWALDIAHKRGHVHIVNWLEENTSDLICY
mmetsp:Transcript_21761/g.28516  ORF Transcript_21761/g.28516 Transcript_21761/m.28516 type:complete len:357 (+) Transcript_21761:104-1174(+)|eukprot:CAMPEP_0117761916 /NCGR_PEP_ID=MMETSP0947-20121206/17576_1 /TAXON_ID=44440 /ORGANISM="Chattonella subsalsa, Strain CCMP2191" /LENGTH=356 /DNA_ID=CAMNT_0005583021 /DNA_START=61 /DNA_END=1131 /DNA_ORIENTATION=+